MKIAIVHDYLNQQGGAERVVETLHQLFRDAPIYTLLYDKDQLLPGMKDARIITSFVQRFKFIRKHFKLFFWLYPFAIQKIKINGFDVVLSSSSAYGKGVSLGKTPNGDRPLHICYCHSPMRFVWNFEEYIRNETSKRFYKKIAGWMIPILRKWDILTSKNVDSFIANSSIVKKRIKNYYGRDSNVIFPPVTLPINPQFKVPLNYFLVVSRLISYKRIDLAVQACTKNNLPLIIIGDGPDRVRLESMAGTSVKFLGYQNEESKREYMSSCKALIFPGEEDFGITPIEVNGFGRPVVAFKAGGALDTIQEGLNGVFFDYQTIDDILVALSRVSELSWDSAAIHKWACNFSRSVFESKILDFLHSSSVMGVHNDNSFKLDN